ncbi:hypothetical protein B296_00041726 [Ensete ventricosum]|uniref:Uncharacterized protein n=1 Tax=Ensete ventricosum TaxID=4639 RepID=A0A426XZG1_ENSVE|nr:hypothetical protein B296_00041726 [Ensete ventricosum]
MFSGKVRDVDERYQVSAEITRSALATAKQTATNSGSSVILSNRYVSTGASWISSALGKVVKEAEDVSMKTREKVDKAEEERKENILHLGTRDATHRQPPAGMTDYRVPATSLATSRGGGADCRGGHPLAGRLLAGKGSHRLRKGDDDNVVRVREEATTSF